MIANYINNEIIRRLVNRSNNRSHALLHFKLNVTELDYMSNKISRLFVLSGQKYVCMLVISKMVEHMKDDMILFALSLVAVPKKSAVSHLNRHSVAVILILMKCLEKLFLQHIRQFELALTPPPLF